MHWRTSLLILVAALIPVSSIQAAEVEAKTVAPSIN